MKKMIKLIKANRNIIIVVIILLIGFGVSFYFQSRQNKLMEKLIKISEESKQSIQAVDTSIIDLSEQLISGETGEKDLVSDCLIKVATPNFANLTADLAVEIVPKEFSKGVNATFYIDDKEVKLEAKDNKYVGTVNVSILKNYNKASVSFEKKSVINNTTIAIDISFLDYFAKQCTVTFEGEKKYGAGEYSYDGNIVWNRTENAFDSILSSKLVRSVNGVVQWSREIPITNVNGTQKYIFQQSFPLENGSEFELYIEQQSKNGFVYRYFIDGGSLKEDDIFTSMEKKTPCELFDDKGNNLLKK